MACLTRDEILAVDDLKLEKVEVPEWGGYVMVKPMTAIARDRFEKQHSDGKLKNYRATIMARCICDDTGNLIFTEADIEALSKKSASAGSRVYNVVLDMSGITKEDEAEMEKL
jgi:hypothetical protein